jgi:multiple sugar transport system substrate-binding protein
MPLLAQEAGADYADAQIDWRQAEGTEITLAGLTHPWMDAIEPLIPQFTELTGITVNVEKQSESEYVAAMPIKLSGGSADPDVFMIWALGQAIEAGWLEPLDAFRPTPRCTMRPGTTTKMCSVVPAVSRPWSDGQSYGQAITAEAQTMFYNGDALEAAGLAVPTTMEELLAAATGYEE